jgi:CDP-6-deoxy-D-xylo-4-hexulose-3-dehydrase
LTKLINANNNYISAFAYPFVNKNINIIIEQLINNNIECRPLICGSMGNQPMYVDRYGKLDLKNCNLIDNYGIYVPCHDKLTDKNIYQIAEILNGV